MDGGGRMVGGMRNLLSTTTEQSISVMYVLLDNRPLPEISSPVFRYPNSGCMSNPYTLQLSNAIIRRTVVVQYNNHFGDNEQRHHQ